MRAFVTSSLAAESHRETGFVYDASASGQSVYAYVQNNPVNFIDPLGLAAECSGQYPEYEGDPDEGLESVCPECYLLGGLRLWQLGKEISFGRNLRIAPFGNRTGDPLGKYPHYHRRGVDADGKTIPGQGIGRHRPWESKSTDTNVGDRF